MSMWVRDTVTDESKKQRRQADYQAVFGNASGRRVLADILSDHGFFREALNEEDRILANAARRILHKLGAWSPGDELAIAGRLLMKETLNDEVH